MQQALDEEQQSAPVAQQPALAVAQQAAPVVQQLALGVQQLATCLADAFFSEEENPTLSNAKPSITAEAKR